MWGLFSFPHGGWNYMWVVYMEGKFVMGIPMPIIHYHPGAAPVPDRIPCGD